MKNRDKRPLSIKSEIFLLSFLFLALVSLIFTGVFLYILYRNNMDNAKNSLRECNRQIVTFAEGMFHENASMLRLLSRDITVINGANGNMEDVLAIYESILRDNANINYIYSAYGNGRLCISGYDVPPDLNPVERPWYKSAESTDGVARTVYTDISSGDWFFSQSKRLLDSGGSTEGIIAIDSSNENIVRQLSARYQYDSQRSFIMNLEGIVLIHPEEEYINGHLTDYMDGEVWEEVISGAGNYGEYKRDNIHVMSYFERIPDTDLIAATAIDAREVTRPIIRSVTFFFCLMTAISIAFGFLLSRLLLYRFARPVVALKSRIEKAAYGQGDADPEISFSNAEISGIAHGIEAFIKEIARREEQQKAAEYLSYHDSMTGLYNRRYFTLQQRSLDTYSNYPLCIICCDVNGLKLVNDVFGHDVGDQLIGKVAAYLSKECRKEDIPARIGGDEFAVIMPHTPAGAAQAFISNLKYTLAEETICGAKVSISMGYGIKTRKGEVLEEIIRQADKIMYSQKLGESLEMRRQTVENIIESASGEGLVKELTKEEGFVLEQMAAFLCRDSGEYVKQSYRLRNIGLCALFQANGVKGSGENCRHTENAYRLLSAVEEYRSMAGYILHFTEHWDGSGWPTGLSGRDIPVISRVLAVADAYFSADKNLKVFEWQPSWYDPEVIAVLHKVIK